MPSPTYNYCLSAFLVFSCGVNGERVFHDLCDLILKLILEMPLPGHFLTLVSKYVVS